MVTPTDWQKRFVGSALAYSGMFSSCTYLVSRPDNQGSALFTVDTRTVLDRTPHEATCTSIPAPICPSVQEQVPAPLHVSPSATPLSTGSPGFCTLFWLHCGHSCSVGSCSDCPETRERILDKPCYAFCLRHRSSLRSTVLLRGKALEVSHVPISGEAHKAGAEYIHQQLTELVTRREESHRGIGDGILISSSLLCATHIPLLWARG